jgi:hypothetical protein
MKKSQTLETTAWLLVAVISSSAGAQTVEQVEVKAHYDNAVGSSDAASQGVI